MVNDKKETVETSTDSSLLDKVYGVAKYVAGIAVTVAATAIYVKSQE